MLVFWVGWGLFFRLRGDGTKDEAAGRPPSSVGTPPSQLGEKSADFAARPKKDPRLVSTGQPRNHIFFPPS